MKTFLFIVFSYICLSFGNLYAQLSFTIPSSIGIANVSVANNTDWSAFVNPASLGYVEHPEIGVQYDNRFMLSQLATKSIAVGIPTKWVNIGANFSQMGYSIYQEMMFGITFAHEFGKKFNIGVQFNYFTSNEHYTQTHPSCFFPQIGLTVHPTDNWYIGFQSFNPFQINIKGEYVNRRMPSIFSLGSNYYFSSQLNWAAQIDKEVSSTFRIATGFEYLLIEQLKVKLGAYGSDYLTPCLGASFKLKNIAFHLNCELHPILGLNTIAGIKYVFQH